MQKKDMSVPIRPSLKEKAVENLVEDAINAHGDVMDEIKIVPDVGVLLVSSQKSHGGCQTISMSSVPSRKFKKNYENDIKEKRKSGESIDRIAKEFNMSVSYVYKLCRKKSNLS